VHDQVCLLNHGHRLTPDQAMLPSRISKSTMVRLDRRDTNPRLQDYTWWIRRQTTRVQVPKLKPRQRHRLLEWRGSESTTTRCRLRFSQRLRRTYQKLGIKAVFTDLTRCRPDTNRLSLFAHRRQVDDGYLTDHGVQPDCKPRVFRDCMAGSRTATTQRCLSKRKGTTAYGTRGLNIAHRLGRSYGTVGVPGNGSRRLGHHKYRLETIS
jgi:hypothetical protein